MAHRNILVCSFFIIFLSVFSSYDGLQEDPLNNYLDEEAPGYDSRVYPSHHSTAHDDGEYFKNLVKLRTEVFSLQKVSKVGGKSTPARTVNVKDFGADGEDDTEKFEKAWKEACSSSEGANVVVPHYTYRLKPITFQGPCKSKITLQVNGVIEASDDLSDYKEDGRHWLVFDRVQNLLVEGGGTIDGNGKIWWQNSCKVDKTLPCKDAPTAITFYECRNLVVKNLKIQNAQKMHVSFEKSKNVQVSNLTVTSPEGSPNTDGIHVTGTQNIQITNSVIGTEDYVSGVTVSGAKFSGTTNGVRIKTWQGGSGSARNIKFLNIEMDNVTNPIIIDQNYCDQDEPCEEQRSAVQVKNVVYKNIKGTVASEVAIKFDCSKTYPCEGILMKDVNLEREGAGTAIALCNNVKLAEMGAVSPNCP
ncbi:hypothetical protein OIU84_011530 [Salix udensis]|uniref:Polygalacturonase n=1 Tax=Salix udensis TaxID=889485 RepID=A0AAD6JND9_9ROSI|nr:hypothetical protein OIU84_011530 [Salix udensis]